MLRWKIQAMCQPNLNLEFKRWVENLVEMKKEWPATPQQGIQQGTYAMTRPVAGSNYQSRSLLTPAINSCLGDRFAGSGLAAEAILVVTGLSKRRQKGKGFPETILKNSEEGNPPKPQGHAWMQECFPAAIFLTLCHDQGGLYKESPGFKSIVLLGSHSIISVTLGSLVGKYPKPTRHDYV